jgi:peptide/nickel transport system substrate-binding protein
MMLFFLTVFCCAACQKTEDNLSRASVREAQSKSRSAVQEDRELVIAIDIERDEGFDPLLGWGSYGSPLFQSTLLKRDENQAVIGDLAKSWVLGENRRVWRIRIRDDAVFSDGKPVTAGDVAFSFNQAARAGGKVDMTALRQAVALDGHTVEIHLKAPRITFINRLITLGIVPEHAYSDTYGRQPIGSGPYRLVQWDEGRQMIMAANPRYYGDKPHIQRVVFMFMEEDAAFAAAKAGAVDVIRVPQMLAVQDLPGMVLHSVPSVDNRGICFPFAPAGSETTEEGYPVGNDVTADMAIRKAVNYAIDRKALVDGVLEGFGSPAYGPVSTLPWDEPQAAIIDGDPRRAKEILAQGGWQDLDGDGIVEKNGVPASFILLYPAGDSVRQALSMAVSDAAAKIGVNAVVNGKSWDDIYKLMHANAVLFGFGSFDQTEMHNLYYGQRSGNAYHNAGFYKNPTVDRYMAEAMKAPSVEDAIPFWQKAQWDGETGYCAKGDAAWAWLVNLDHTYFVDERLDIGNIRTEQHGSFIIANLPQWKWNSGNHAAGADQGNAVSGEDAVAIARKVER